MKLIGLVTSSILILSSAALAAPSAGEGVRAPLVRDHRAPAATITRDHRLPAPGPRLAVGGSLEHVAPRWTVLDTIGARPGRQLIRVPPGARFSTLKLEAKRGPIRVEDVMITFANGRTQRVELDTRIDRGSSAVIDLRGNARQISRIVITTRGNRRAALTVLAG